MRNKVDDFSVDGVFNDSDIARSTDAQTAALAGRVAAVTDSQARHL